MPLRFARMTLQASSPPITGISTSRITRSGLNFSSRITASFPFVAVMTLKFFPSRYSFIMFRTAFVVIGDKNFDFVHNFAL